MPPKVDPVKCDGCRGDDVPVCEMVCPGDLMTLDSGVKKAYCREPGDCWDCMTCAKYCPRQAIQTQLSYQIACFPCKLIPLVAHNSVTWTSIDCHGKVERFAIKTVAGEDDDD